MVLHAFDDKAELPDGDDARHHAGAQPLGFELGSLLDMHLEEALVAGRVQLRPRQAFKARLAQRLAERLAVVAVLQTVDLAVFQDAEQRAAADEAAVVALLIGEGDDIHRQPGAGKRDTRHHTQRAIQPAGLILAFDMAAHQQMRTRPGVAAEDIADAVHAGLQPHLAHAVHQPAAAFHVLGREGGAVHAGLVGPDLPKLVQVLEEPFRVHLRHAAPLSRSGRG
ncbi:hypothetical protein [Roseococcus microcysteis]|uniref:hypothetical protein n=1 Tax=Roseococcus microcysteis TaxID=2771361 RepID=UPI002FC34DC6